MVVTLKKIGNESKYEIFFFKIFIIFIWKASLSLTQSPLQQKTGCLDRAKPDNIAGSAALSLKWWKQEDSDAENYYFYFFLQRGPQGQTSKCKMLMFNSLLGFGKKIDFN